MKTITISENDEKIIQTALTLLSEQVLKRASLDEHIKVYREIHGLQHRIMFDLPFENSEGLKNEHYNRC